MNRKTQAIHEDAGRLAEDARSSMADTADVAEEKVEDVRKRLADALERVKEFYGRVREKTIEGARAADKTMREHPYQVMGIAVVAGALIGFLVARRYSRND